MLSLQRQKFQYPRKVNYRYYVSLAFANYAKNAQIWEVKVDNRKRFWNQKKKTHNVRKRKKTTKTHHNVCILIEEAQEFFQTPEAATETSEEEFGELVIGSFESPLKTEETSTQKPEYGDKKGAEGQGTRIVDQSTAARGEQQPEAAAAHYSLTVALALRIEVEGGKGARQGYLIQGNEEIYEPDTHDEVVHLQPGCISEKNWCKRRPEN